jgi:hypothetical protein
MALTMCAARTLALIVSIHSLTVLNRSGPSDLHITDVDAVV